MPSEVKKFELEILKKQRQTEVRQKQPYQDYLQHVREENVKIKAKKKVV